MNYQYLDQEQHRNNLYQFLSELWEITYERTGKSLTFARTIYQRLQDEKETSKEMAIRHAKRLLELHADKPCHLQNPVKITFH